VTFDELMEYLTVAKRLDDRDVITDCPVHGGSDSLHISEVGGRVLAHCFNPACGAGLPEVEKALAASAEPVTVRRSTRRPARRERMGDVAAATKEGSESPPLPPTSMLDWAAERSGVTRGELDALALPLANSGAMLKFRQPSGAKVRER
jgi:hypothetical protein